MMEIQNRLLENTPLPTDLTNIIAGLTEIKKFEVGQITRRFKVIRKTSKSLFIIYTNCNVEQRTKLFFDDFGGEYAKYNKEIIYP